ncbi:leucine-rich repeat domain-containing protein [Chryseobacterium kwangjuense]|uniref:Leucine-rich repeat domain-containing protein n=1 Tax=Chryseobacterium kwangjuense TaxID=267125 RepID=A0ABW9K8R0_9FLAO
MKKIEQIAQSFGIAENQYSYEMNHSKEVVSLEIFEPEYDYSPGFTGTRLMKFVSSFKNLESLEIDVDDLVIDHFNEISDLKHLKTLHIECDTKVSNLDFLSRMEHLQHLYIQSSHINDLTGIERHHKLTALFLGNTAIRDLNPLRGLADLEQVGIFHSRIEDINCLKDLKNLRIINLQNNNIKDLSVFSEMKDIQHLDLSFNQIGDIDSVKDNVNLMSLNISNNEIEDVSVIRNFQNLNDLSLANNKVEDISALENIKLVNNLNISGNRIREIAPLKNLENLKIFNAGNNPLEDIQTTEFAARFTYLNLENCGISNISFLLNQQRIVYLNLNMNSVSDFSPLEGMADLKEIDLRFNNITETFPVHYFSDLNVVDLAGNPFGNMKFHIYRGQDLDGRKMGLLSDLAKLNADYYFNKGMMDEALAYFYFEKKHTNQHPQVFYIYLQKMLDTASSETVYMKYYFSRMTDFLCFYENSKWLSDEDYNKLHSKIALVKEPERTSMLETLNKIKEGKRTGFNFNYYDFHFYEGKVSNPYISDELLFIKGSMQVGRDQLMTNLYYLKLLKKRNSPFYFTLLHKIKHVLKMNFAYTEPERKEHDYYRDLIHNIDKSNIPESKVSFSGSHFSKHYQYVHYKHPVPGNKKKDSERGSNMVVFIGFVVVAFALLMAVRSCLNLF